MCFTDIMSLFLFSILFHYSLLCLVIQSCLTLCDPMDWGPPGSSVHGDSPGKNTGVGWHALLQGVFPTQGSNPGLPHCRQFFTSWATREAQESGDLGINSSLICDHVIFVMAASLGYLPFRWGGWGGGGIPYWTQQKSGWWGPVYMEVPVLDSERHQCFQSVPQDSVRCRYFKEKMFLIGISLKKFRIKKAKWSLFVYFLQWRPARILSMIMCSLSFQTGQYVVLCKLTWTWNIFGI